MGRAQRSPSILPRGANDGFRFTLPILRIGEDRLERIGPSRTPSVRSRRLRRAMPSAFAQCATADKSLTRATRCRIVTKALGQRPNWKLGSSIQLLQESTLSRWMQTDRRPGKQSFDSKFSSRIEASRMRRPSRCEIAITMLLLRKIRRWWRRRWWWRVAPTLADVRHIGLGPSSWPSVWIFPNGNTYDDNQNDQGRSKPRHVMHHSLLLVASLALHNLSISRLLGKRIFEFRQEFRRVIL